jgi:predicted metal-binding membrane protein
MLGRIRGRNAAITGGVFALTALCWAWIVPMARDMYGAMTGPSAWMMTSDWDAAHTVLLWAMWAVMMAGMMLPTALPVLMFYSSALARRQEPSRATVRVYAMAAGYVLVWSLFSVAATVLQRVLSNILLLNPMMEMASRPATAALLAAAGVYQLTPLKQVCLQSCRSPLTLVMRHWRAGIWGAWHMGVEHGLYCLGCCWLLMLLLFAGGVMNLYVIGALTAFVLIEKLAPAGVQIGRAGGVALIGAALWLMIR